MEYRLCKRCNENKSVDMFYKKKDAKSGLTTYCKKCSQLYCKESRHKNKEKVRQYYKKYNAENRDSVNASKKKWAMNNKDKVKECMRNHYLRNQDKLREYARKWYKKNNEKMRFRAKRMKAQRRKVMVAGFFTKSQWNSCLNYFGHSCAYCGSKHDIQLEHFVPISKGGEHSRSNIIPACKICNVRKQNKSFEEWYINSGSYDEIRKQSIYKYLGYEENVQQIALF